MSTEEIITSEANDSAVNEQKLGTVTVAEEQVVKSEENNDSSVYILVCKENRHSITEQRLSLRCTHKRIENLATNSKLDSGQPFVAVQRLVVPTKPRLALTIGCKSHKVLLYRSISSASPSLNFTVSYGSE